MAKYRKKPIVIEAIRWTGENFEELADLVEGSKRKVKSKEGDVT